MGTACVFRPPCPPTNSADMSDEGKDTKYGDEYADEKRADLNLNSNVSARFVSSSLTAIHNMLSRARTSTSLAYTVLTLLFQR